jgi:hypothetical protein
MVHKTDQKGADGLIVIDSKLEQLNIDNFGAGDERNHAEGANHKKRKPKGTLVNPYLKKRKV